MLTLKTLTWPVWAESDRPVEEVSLRVLQVEPDLYDGVYVFLQRLSSKEYVSLGAAVESLQLMEFFWEREWRRYQGIVQNDVLLSLRRYSSNQKEILKLYFWNYFCLEIQKNKNSLTSSTILVRLADRSEMVWDYMILWYIKYTYIIYIIWILFSDAEGILTLASRPSLSTFSCKLPKCSVCVGAEWILRNLEMCLNSSSLSVDNEQPLDVLLLLMTVYILHSHHLPLAFSLHCRRFDF